MKSPKAQFGESILLLATALGFDLDEAVIGVYWHALKDVPSDLRVETLLEAANRKWFKFPTPADLKKIAAELIETRRKEAFRESLPADCPDCGGSRWRPVTIDGVERLERCGCWQAAKKAMERVGQPIALPPSRDEHTEERP